MEGASSGEVSIEILAHNFGKDESMTIQKGIAKENENTKKRIGPGRYHASKQLAAGGFGNIYLARDTYQSDKEVILKKIRCENFKDANLKLQEFLPMKMITHENLIKYDDLYLMNEDDTFYICYIMRLFNNKDLKKRINLTKGKKTYFPFDLVVHYMRQLIEGVLFLHNNQLVHRDLKPAVSQLKNFNIKIQEHFNWR